MGLLKIDGFFAAFKKITLTDLALLCALSAATTAFLQWRSGWHLLDATVGLSGGIVFGLLVMAALKASHRWPDKSKERH